LPRSASGVALKLKGLPFEEIPIDILSGEQFQPDYAAVSAERVVPTFIHDGHSIFQSLADYRISRGTASPSRG